MGTSLDWEETRAEKGGVKEDEGDVQARELERRGIKELVTQKQTAGWFVCLTEPCT